jgi:hypothetical protein
VTFVETVINIRVPQNREFFDRLRNIELHCSRNTLLHGVSSMPLHSCLRQITSDTNSGNIFIITYVSFVAGEFIPYVGVRAWVSNAVT